MFKDKIGEISNKVKNVVERGAVKKFAEAIGDPHPLYLDEETGRLSCYHNNIAPPTFPRVFDYGVIKDFHLPIKGLIHGEQSFHYERPLVVGEDIFCFTKIKNYFEKKGNFGKMGFLVLENYGEDTNEKLIFSSTSTIVISEAVRQVLTK